MRYMQDWLRNGDWPDSGIEENETLELVCQEVKWSISPIKGTDLARQIAHQYIRYGDFGAADIILAKMVLPNLVNWFDGRKRKKGAPLWPGNDYAFRFYFMQNETRIPAGWNVPVDWATPSLVVVKRHFQIETVAKNSNLSLPHQDEREAEIISLWKAHNPSLDDVAKLTLLLASPTKDTAIPSKSNEEAVFVVAEKWIEILTKQDGVDKPRPSQLYISLSCACGLYAKPDIELSRIPVEARLQWMNTSKGPELVCGKFTSANITPNPGSKPAEKIAEVYAFRAEHGIQETMPEKSMADLVKQLVDLSWECWAEHYLRCGITSPEQLTALGLSDEEIGDIERRCEMNMPEDYKSLLRVTNG
jgi:hypothetical protein